MPGTTTNFGWSYPVNTDPLADGAQEIQNFADAADTTFVDLLGGTTDQYLAKNSNTDMDFKWVAGPAVYGIPFISTFYYEGLRSGSSVALTATEDVTYYQPIYIPTSTTFDRIAMRTRSTHTGTSTVRLGVYNMGVGVPTTVALDAGTVSATAASTTYTITINQTLSAGWYWLAANVQAKTGTSAVEAADNGSSMLLVPGIRSTTGTNLGNGFPVFGFEQTGVTGAFATAGTLTASQTVIIVGLRKA